MSGDSNGFGVKIDRPHQPHGPHVDDVRPLGEGLPGAIKTRIGPDGNVINQEINIKGGHKVEIKH